MEYVIKPGIGFNEAAFGTAPENIEALYGSPDEKDVDTDDDMRSEMWVYFDLKLTFFFEGDDIRRLVSVESGHPETKLFDKALFRLKEKDLIALLKDHQAEMIETENEDWGERRVSWDDMMMDFYFKDDKLITVNWSIVAEDDD